MSLLPLTYVPIVERFGCSKMMTRSTRDQKGLSVMENIRELLGEPSAVKTPKFLNWVRGSKVLAFGWTAMRVWLGIMWIQAGVAKLWGAENPAFLHNNGAGVAGFASHGVPAYSWWGSFMHSFVVPNAGWIAILVAVAEFSIGVALSLGLFTRIAALASLGLLFTYVMSGTASVCAFYAFFAIVVLATWRTSSWIGVDGLVSGYRQRHHAVAVSEDPSDIAALATPASSASPLASRTPLGTPAATNSDDVTSTKDEPVPVS
jgi:thiosulfate dehydrogenase [quinone] large subunit